MKEKERDKYVEKDKVRERVREMERKIDGTDAVHMFLT